MNIYVFIISYLKLKKKIAKRLPNSTKENYKKEKKEFYKPVSEKEYNKMFIQYMMYTIIKRIKTLHEEMRKNKENLNKSKNVDDNQPLPQKDNEEIKKYIDRKELLMKNKLTKRQE